MMHASSPHKNPANHWAAAVIAVIVLSAGLFTLGNAASPTRFDGKSWWEHLKVLAADDMEGRDTGSEGLRKAQAYVIQQLKAAGLEPAGIHGYFQPIEFISRKIDETESSLALVRDGRVEPLTLGEDAFFSTRVNLEPAIEAPLVFAGYGLQVPEMGYDDVAGLDLNGKIAVVFNGIPSNVPGPLASHYQAKRWKTMKAAGAVGLFLIRNPASMDIPWSRLTVLRTRTDLALAGPEFDETAGEKIAGEINPERVDKFFAASGHSFQDVLALSKDRKQLPRFPLNISLRARTKTIRGQLECSNVIAKLPGSDAKLKSEYVVLSAHVDHLGIGAPINGDRIYHGAMDNAAGVAVLLDVVAALKKAAQKPRRSLLFVFFTAEEKGKLGSEFFTAHPTLPLKSMVADINIDMFLPLYPMKLVAVYGLNESDLGDDIRQVAQQDHIEVEDDPEPQRYALVRSDQYNFILHGIPALTMKVGYIPGSPEDKIFHDWLHKRYHAPSDDLKQPMDVGAAGKYEEVTSQLMMKVANDPGRRQWKTNSFFRRYAQSSGGE